MYLHARLEGLIAVVQVVNSWPIEKRLQFLQFVTGASRPCLPQMELLRVAMPFTARHSDEWQRVLCMLPQVRVVVALLLGSCSTCGRTEA